MDKQDFEKVAKKIEGYRNEMIEMQKKLISFLAMDPENGGKGETEKANFLVPFLKKYFDNVTECHAPDKRVPAGLRPNYIATINGKNASKTLWLMAHLDVVPAGDEKAWHTPPFEAVVKDGKIYGRGAEDNNQAIVSSLFTVKAFKECGVTPNIGIGLLLVSDEEMGTQTYGAKYVLDNKKSIFKKDDLIIVPDSGNLTGTDIVVAEKSITWLKITTIGKQAHAAQPHKGINAHRANAHLIVMVDNLKNKYSESNPIFDVPTSTIEPTKKEANIPNVNTVPGEDIICFDCRMLPSVNNEAFMNDIKGICSNIEKQFGVKINLETLCSIQSPATPNDAPVVKAIQKAAEEILKTMAKPIGIGGGTVCGKFRNAGFNIVVYSVMHGTFHQSNEFCELENLIKDSKIWAHVALFN